MRSWAGWLFGGSDGSAAAVPAAAASPALPGPEEPEDLTCPISACLYRDPVMLVSGHTFERVSIVEFWRRRPLANPLGTGERLRTAQMIINYGCRSQVDSWLERHPGYVPEGWSSREDKRRSTQSDLDGISSEIENAAKQADERAAAEAAAEEEEARQQLADAAATVYLVGDTPGGVHRDYLGVYEREPELVNGRMAYAMADDPTKMLWFSRTNGYWHAGPRANLGSPRGWLAVFDRSALPELVTAEWQVGAANGGGWNPAPEVRCLAGMAGAAAHAAMGQDTAAVPAELEGAAAVVYLVGPTAEGVNRKYIGAYGRGSQIVNGRFTYSRIGQGGDPMRMLWYCDGGESAGQWWAGPKGNLGSPAGWLAVHDSALTPESITAPWRAIPRGGTGWLELPGLRCATGEAGERLHLEEVEAHRVREAEEARLLLLAAAQRVHLVGMTPDGVHNDYLGAYDREPGLVNGRPSYAMAGCGEKMLWFSNLNGYWHAGPRSNLGGPRGWLAVYDLAPLPERVTGQWQVGAVDSSWTAAPDVRCLAAQPNGPGEQAARDAHADAFPQRRSRDDGSRPTRSRRRCRDVP